MGYAVVLGEALVDLLEADLGGELIYHQATGGAPLYVSVGATRLGGHVRARSATTRWATGSPRSSARST